VSLLLRPLVCPAVSKVTPERRLEVRFFAPGGLVSNLDFVESIFGNAGDPHLPANDAGLDVEGWTGHSGCVILAPHLTRVRKKDIGLPYEREDDLYNEGRSFKLTSRGPQGVMVTLIADNYFGYCKKEVKTQIGYSANLFGLAEEEHAGGALAFPTFNLGDRFTSDQVRVVTAGHRLTEVLHLLGDRARRHPSGYATDALWPAIHYMPEDMEIDIHRQDITWRKGGEPQHLKLLPGRIYFHPSGYRIRMEKHHAAPSWRLVGTVPEGAFCHKPCTVSGGGKSEISKSLVDAVLPGSFFVQRFDEDMALVESILRRSYDDVGAGRGPARPLLDPERSLGSVIKLLTPNPAEFPPEYNAWLESVPNHVRALVFVIKRFHRAEWGEDWRRYFGVDIINGAPGHELKYEGRKLVANYLRIGRARPTARGAPTSCGRTSSRPTRCRWRTTSPPPSWFPPAGWWDCPASTTGTRASSWRRTASSGCSSGRTTRSTRGRTGRPRRTCRAPGSSAPTSSRSGGRTCRRSGRTSPPTTASRRRCGSTWTGTRRGTTKAGPSAPRGPGSSPRGRPRTRATSSSGPTWRGRATATSPRWARG
jgi:hypothetical protein